MEPSAASASMLSLEGGSQVASQEQDTSHHGSFFAKAEDDSSPMDITASLPAEFGTKENEMEGAGQWITPKSKLLLQEREEARRRFENAVLPFRYSGMQDADVGPGSSQQKRKLGLQDKSDWAYLEEAKREEERRRINQKILDDFLQEELRKEKQNAEQAEQRRKLEQLYPRLDNAEGNELLRRHGISNSIHPRRGPQRATSSQPNPSSTPLIVPSSSCLPVPSQPEPDIGEPASQTCTLGEAGSSYANAAAASEAALPSAGQADPSARAPKQPGAVGNSAANTSGTRGAPTTIRREGEDGVTSEERASLSPEQRRALEEAEAGRNLFITGSAGVGKSHLVDLIVRALTAQGKVVRTTASTGIAAVNVGGTTLHSFAGVGRATEPMFALGTMVARSKKARETWKTTDALVIDEVSMISDELFDKVEYVGRCCRGWPDGGEFILHPQAFGGVQVIAVGDFFQLPPVEKSIRFVGFCFQGEGWAKSRFLTVELVKVFRQSDQQFIHLLQMLRRGLVSDEAVQMLRRCTRPLSVEDGILPTMLYPHRNSVAAENTRHFDALTGHIAMYTADDMGSENLLPILDRDVQAPKRIPLKLKTQVMLLTNMDFEAGLVNGSRGVVVGFETVHEWRRKGFKEDRGAASRFEPCKHWLERHEVLPIVLFASGVTRTIPPAKWEHAASNGREKARRVQMPLIHAWALTIHKCQGMTLDRVRMSLSQVFAEGMAYVALSRCRSLEGIQIDDFNSMKIRAHPLVLSFYQMLRNLEEVPSVTNGLAEGPNMAGPSEWITQVSDCVHGAMSSSTRMALERARTKEDVERVRQILVSLATQGVDSIVERWRPPTSDK